MESYQLRRRKRSCSRCKLRLRHVLRPSVPPSLRPASAFHAAGNGQMCQHKCKNIRIQLSRRNGSKQPSVGAGWTSRWAKSLLTCRFSQTSRQISGSVPDGNDSIVQKPGSLFKWREPKKDLADLRLLPPTPSPQTGRAPPGLPGFSQTFWNRNGGSHQGESALRARIGSSVQTQLAEDRLTLWSVWRL